MTPKASWVCLSGTEMRHLLLNGGQLEKETASTSHRYFFWPTIATLDCLFFLLHVTHWFLWKWQNVFALNVGQVGQATFPPTCLLASSTRLYCPEIIPVLPLSRWQSTPDEGKLPGWEIRWKRELICHARSRGQVSVLLFMPKYLQIISLSIFFNQRQKKMLENKTKLTPWIQQMNHYLFHLKRCSRG